MDRLYCHAISLCVVSTYDAAHSGDKNLIAYSLAREARASIRECFVSGCYVPEPESSMHSACLGPWAYQFTRVLVMNGVWTLWELMLLQNLTTS